MPTGIDRVCLAYVEHFRGRAEAVVWRGGRNYVLDPRHSDELFDLFLRGSRGFRHAFVKLAARAVLTTRRSAQEGQFYLNVGHTGLDDPSLAEWVRRSRIKAIFLIHDLIPIIHPRYCRAGEQVRHVRRMENVLRSAAGIIGNSQATIDDLANFAASSGLTMPPAVRAFIAGAPISAEVRPKLFDRPHFITVGTIEARKNHVMLLHIWQKLIAKYGSASPLLLIAGQRGWKAQSAIAILDEAADLKGHVLELGTCGDEQLASLVAAARALLMPSFAEGFGLPIIEALQLRTPVIASNLHVFREFADDIPTYVDPLDWRGWENAIVSFTGDAPERKRQLQAMQTYRPPSWPQHFAIVDDWLRTL